MAVYCNFMIAGNSKTEIENRTHIRRFGSLISYCHGCERFGSCWEQLKNFIIESIYQVIHHIINTPSPIVLDVT